MKTAVQKKKIIILLAVIPAVLLILAVAAHIIMQSTTRYTRTDLPKLAGDYRIDTFQKWNDERKLTIYYREKIAKFEAKNEKLEPGCVLFVGDSMTDFLDRKVYYPTLTAAQQGIAGDTTRGVLNRMDTIYNAQPAVIVLLIGGNDIMNEHRTPENIAVSYEQILSELTENLPDTAIIVESICPGRDGTIYQWADRQEDVVATNVYIKALAEKYGCVYADAYDLLVGDDGLIKPEYCEDGIHLTPEGYEVVSGYLTPIIEDALQ